MIPMELAPYLSVASMGACAAMAASFWRLSGGRERRRERRVRGAIAGHVSSLVDILEDVYSRAEKADRGEAEARAACAYFARRAHRLEALRLSIEGLLPGLDQDAGYAREVRRILGVESWLIERYHDPTIPDDKRFHLWRSGGADLERRIGEAVAAATSLGIVQPVTIR